MSKNDNTDKKNEETLNLLKDQYKSILSEIGEDSEREGLLKTPSRAGKAMQFLTQGYNQDPISILNNALFHEDYSVFLAKGICPEKRG